MSEIDLKLYVSEFKRFFKTNPDRLKSLIGNADSQLFFEEVEKTARKNLQEGTEINLTIKQISEIVVKLSDQFIESPPAFKFYNGQIASFSLN